MRSDITTVAFDADDTLWHNETFFKLTEARFADLLRDYAEPDHLLERLVASERKNLGHYGFGIKGFMLSMIETALEVTNHQVPGHVIAELIAAGQEMLAHPIELLPHARKAVELAAGRYRVLLITKGDLLDQERKLAQSGLGDLFDGIEIVSDKSAPVYGRIFHSHGDGAARGMMVGNSVKSDILPMLEIGGWAVHVPHDFTWALEAADKPQTHPRLATLPDLSGLPDVLQQR